jgi:hypothetical protein
MSFDELIEVGLFIVGSPEDGGADADRSAQHNRSGPSAVLDELWWPPAMPAWKIELSLVVTNRS